jgi:hypothetical protein
MRFRTIVAGALLLIGGASSASATMLITEDRGGQIGQYLQAFAALRSSGDNVVVDGNGFSACTLLLGLIPRQRVCATPNARFGFHAAWMPDENGRPVTSPQGTQALWRAYPSSVRSWIGRNGGLSRKMIFLEGRALSHIVQSCDSRDRTVTARSHHQRALPREVRYGGARAASNSR